MPVAVTAAMAALLVLPRAAAAAARPDTLPAAASMRLLLRRCGLDRLRLSRLRVRRERRAVLPTAAVGRTRCSSTQNLNQSWLFSSVGRTCMHTTSAQ